MGFFKKIFGLEEEERKEEIKLVADKRFVTEKCSICTGEIGYDRWKKIKGMYFHKVCWKKRMNEVRDGRI